MSAKKKAKAKATGRPKSKTIRATPQQLEAITLVLDERGWSGKKLGEIVGVSTKSITEKIKRPFPEDGRNFSGALFIRVMAALNIPTNATTIDTPEEGEIVDILRRARLWSPRSADKIMKFMREMNRKIVDIGNHQVEIAAAEERPAFPSLLPE